MLGIRSQQLVVVSRKLLKLGREFFEVPPELARRVMAQISRVLPRSNSARASAANSSSFPSAESRSI